MNAFLFILTGLVVLAGSILIGLAPIWKQHEKHLRVFGVCLTFAGGVLGIVIGLRSAAKTDSLMQNTAKILQKSDTALNAIDQTLTTSKDVLNQSKENLAKTQESLDAASKNLEIASKATRISQEAFSYASGGGSSPEIFPRSITREDGKPGIGFYLIKRGKYPLYPQGSVQNRPCRVTSKPAIAGPGL